MTSLMQNFAKARQIRIEERSTAIAALQSWQQVQRQAQITRQQEVQARATAVKSELAENEQERLVTASLATKQRLHEVQDRVVLMRSQLQEFTQTRFDTAKTDRAIRLQELTTRVNEVRSLLEKINGDRLVMSAILWQELSDYTNYIHNYVYGIEAKPEAIAEINLEVSIAEISLEVSEVPPLNPISNPTSQFIQTYVSNLGATLGQVVNDRDQVRDLLATGANALKIDPSEILNTLLKMVDLEN